MSDVKFVEGLVVRAPHAKAPAYVKASLSMRRQQLMQWLHDQNGEWVNVDIKQAQSGKWYAAVNDWSADETQKPKPSRAPAKAQSPAQHAPDFDDDIGF